MAGVQPYRRGAHALGRTESNFSCVFNGPVTGGGLVWSKGWKGLRQMLQDSWCFYEERLPRKRIFHPRKRSLIGPLFTIAAAVLVLFEAISRF